MGAEGSQSSIAIIEETTWGETPAGNMQGVNFTSEDMSMKVDNKISDNVRPDRQTADLVQVGASTEGGINTEMQFGNLDTVIEGFFWDNWQEDTPVAGTKLLQNGVVKHSYSIQRSNNDIQQYFIYKGMTPNVISWNIEEGSPVTISLSFVGKDESLSTTKVEEDAPATTSIINAVSSVTEVAIDGVPIAACLVQKLSVTLDNKAEGKKGIGVLGYCNVNGKSIEVKGNISMYFNDAIQYNRYIESESFSLKVTFEDLDGNGIVLTLPACKYDTSTANVTGKDDDVMFEASFVAIMDATDEYTISYSYTPHA